MTTWRESAARVIVRWYLRYARTMLRRTRWRYAKRKRLRAAKGMTTTQLVGLPTYAGPSQADMNRAIPKMQVGSLGAFSGGYSLTLTAGLDARPAMLALPGPPPKWVPDDTHVTHDLAAHRLWGRDLLVLFTCPECHAVEAVHFDYDTGTERWGAGCTCCAAQWDAIETPYLRRAATYKRHPAGVILA